MDASLQHEAMDEEGGANAGQADAMLIPAIDFDVGQRGVCIDMKSDSTT